MSQSSEIDVQILAEGRMVDLNVMGLDAAIRFGHGKYPGLHAACLMPDSAVPVCSPNMLAAQRVKIEGPEDVLSLPLLLLVNAIYLSGNFAFPEFGLEAFAAGELAPGKEFGTTC